MSKELSEDGADPKNGAKMAANETGSKVGGPIRAQSGQLEGQLRGGGSRAG